MLHRTIKIMLGKGCSSLITDWGFLNSGSLRCDGTPPVCVVFAWTTAHQLPKACGRTNDLNTKFVLPDVLYVIVFLL